MPSPSRPRGSSSETRRPAQAPIAGLDRRARLNAGISAARIGARRRAIWALGWAACLAAAAVHLAALLLVSPGGAAAALAANYFVLLIPALITLAAMPETIATSYRWAFLFILTTVLNEAGLLLMIPAVEAWILHRLWIVERQAGALALPDTLLRRLPGDHRQASSSSSETVGGKAPKRSSRTPAAAR